MKPKKHFNDLVNSIVVSVITLVFLTLTTLFIYAVAIQYQNDKSISAGLVITSIFGIITIILLITIISFCYSYWYIDSENLFGKKLFRKTVMIKFIDIKKIEKKNTPMHDNWFSPDSMYVFISTNGNKIQVYFNQQSNILQEIIDNIGAEDLTKMKKT